MTNRLVTSIVSAALLGATLAIAACASANSNDAGLSPVTAGSTVATIPNTGDRVFGNAALYDRSADDQSKIAKVVAPVPATWDALVAAMSARMTSPTILDRTVGRVGDTSLVLIRRWNGEQLSKYLNCGVTMEGPRADGERIRAVFLAQMTRLKADTVAIAVFLTASSTSLTGGGVSACNTTGRMEKETLDDIYRRLGVRY